ncbi:uncharacterized protein K441DRAFT_614554 [Cenococcum geophilum 1.58]|uniref:uncharacterized protein n=1 Tax=Cenococcum geophilum 1.58 TaxID=794803 RepID=UPI00358E0EB2|nr:hypothetical protein K441DRAFT_614554 [Cenococcum geophilum 1.58]
MHPNTDFRRLGNMLTKVRLLVLDEFVGYLDELTPLALVRNVIKNYAQLEAREKVRVVKAEEVGELYGGMFANAKYNDMTGVLLNESSGWAEAGEVLESVIGTAIASGVKFVEADITTLLFDGRSDCISVKTADERILSLNPSKLGYAEQIILATRARTSTLIADSAPGWKDLQVGDRLTAAALFTRIAKLSNALQGRTGLLASWRPEPRYIPAVGNK